jgi:sugar (glycoside-pentoside-hexuronide) transporter
VPNVSFDIRAELLPRTDWHPAVTLIRGNRNTLGVLMASDSGQLRIREKLAYGLGDSAANLIGASQATFLLFFYTDVFGISAMTAGGILLASRVVDAVSDPLVAAIADRTTTRWGRYRPWLLWTAIPLAAALVLCFTTPNLSATGKLVWAIVTYNVLMIMYAANNIPYCALSGVMTSDTNERTNLASWRFLCAMAATLVVNVFTLDLVERFGRGNTPLGYQLAMLLWGLVAIVSFITTFAFTRERVAPDPKVRSSLRQDLADLAGNGPWIALFVLAALIHVQLALRSGATLYYFEHYQQAPRLTPWINNFGLFNGIGLVAVMVGVVFSNPISKRIGKRKTFQICLLISAFLMASFAWLPRDSTYGLFSLLILMQLAFAPTIPLLWAMMADVADYGEWKTGRRSTALAFASIVFGLKLGFGVGGWLNGSLLDWANYTAGSEESESALRMIVLLISILPASALLLGFVALWFYGIDKQLEHEIESTLRAKRLAIGGGEVTA